MIFTLPALFLWQMDPSLARMTLLALCGGILGILFMIPLRRFLIVREHGKLPYPEGTACARVLVAARDGGAGARPVFIGLAVGAFVRLLTHGLFVIPKTLKVAVPGIPKAVLGCSIHPALIGVGYILGPRVSTVMVGGGLLGALVIIPGLNAYYADAGIVYPETVLPIAEMSAKQIWDRYVRYIGAGAVAMAGFITLVRSVPTMIESFRIGASEMRQRREEGSSEADQPRTQRDLPLKVVGFGALAVIAVLAIVPIPFEGIGGGLFGRVTAALLVGLFAFFFVTVSSRIVGLVGVTSNPTSGMTIASLLGTSAVFLALGWTDDASKAAALCVGTVIAIAASIAGDTSQDLKTGFILGATPRRQQLGELLGVLTSAAAVCYSVILLDQAFGLGSEEVPAPQGTLMKLVVDGVLDSSLPWGLIAIGAGIAVVVELFRLPSLAFAVGVYLPVSTMMAVFLGGLIRWIVQSRYGKDHEGEAKASEPGVLFGSGLVGGVGLVGILLAFVAIQRSDSELPTVASLVSFGESGFGVFAGVLVVMVLLFVLSRYERRPS